MQPYACPRTRSTLRAHCAQAAHRRHRSDPL